MPTSCSITAVSWTRVHLSVTVVMSGLWDEGDVQFKIVDGRRKFPVTTQQLGPELFRLDLNITNFRSRRQIPDGTWRFVPFIGTERGPAATYDLSDLEKLADDSRTFIYNGNRSSYMVVFGISEDDERPDLLMRTYAMSRRPRATPARKRSRLRSPKAWLTKKLLPESRKLSLLNRLYRFARRVQPPRGNRILFASEMRAQIEGNLLALRDRMLERGLDRQWQLRYSFRLPHTRTKQNTLRLVWLLATSDIVLIDDYFVLLQLLRISPDTKIIQAWHAGSGFKSVGYSRFGNYGSPKLQNSHRKYTYVLTGSTHLIPVYAEAFGIEESAVIPTGLPRIDSFLDPVRSQKVVRDFFADYPHLQGKKIILFAPTFRGRGSTTARYDYSRIDFEKFYEVCGDDAVVLFRMHHFIREPIPIPIEFADRLFDFSTYPDTNDLLHVTDILITDYSSIIYEFSLLNRPMLFFAYDKEVYAATRGFHRDYELTAPGKVCETMDDLVKALQDEDYDMWKIEAFRRENFDVIDTHSSDRVIDQLILSDPRTSEIPAEESIREETTLVAPAVGDSGPGGSAATDAEVVVPIVGMQDEA